MTELLVYSDHQSNKSFPKTRQIDFFPLVDLAKIKLPPPTRTFNQAVRKDFLPTIELIRFALIPGYNLIENSFIRTAVWWYEKQNTEIKDNGFPLPTIKLPFGVLVNYNTLSFWHEARLASNKKDDFLVSYAPLTKDWEKDVLGAVSSCFEKLKAHPFETKKFIPDTPSTTRTLNILSDFFQSGGSSDSLWGRYEAIDLLTAELYNHYWPVLSRREKTHLM